MKKFAFILSAAVLLLGLTSCNKQKQEEPSEPEVPVYVGEWYLDSTVVNMSISAMGQDYSQNIDTAFHDRSECFSLEQNNTIRYNGDSIGTYQYDELEGTLSVHTDMISQMMGEEGISEMIPMNLTDFVFQANFTKTAAKLSYSQNASGTAMGVVPYSYDVQMKLYFEK